jgi:hypothetical protein
MFKTKIIKFLKSILNFFLWEQKHNATKVAEEYCWAITQAAGQLCCCRLDSTVLELDFNWTPLYIHSVDDIFILNSTLHKI